MSTSADTTLLSGIATPRAPHPSEVRREPPPATARLHRMARAFAHLFLEVERGARSRRHLQNLVCPVLFARLSQVWVRSDRSPARVGRVIGDRTAAGCYQAVATVHRPDRTTALAFQLRRTAAGWQVDDLLRPEEGALPEPPFPVPADGPDAFDLVL